MTYRIANDTDNSFKYGHQNAAFLCIPFSKKEIGGLIL